MRASERTGQPPLKTSNHARPNVTPLFEVEWLGINGK
jgi:hypothetical protein